MPQLHLAPHNFFYVFRLVDIAYALFVLPILVFLKQIKIINNNLQLYKLINNNQQYTSKSTITGFREIIYRISEFILVQQYLG